MSDAGDDDMAVGDSQYTGNHDDNPESQYNDGKGVRYHVSLVPLAPPLKKGEKHRKNKKIETINRTIYPHEEESLADVLEAAITVNKGARRRRRSGSPTPTFIDLKQNSTVTKLTYIRLYSPYLTLTDLRRQCESSMMRHAARRNLGNEWPPNLQLGLTPNFIADEKPNVLLCDGVPQCDMAHIFEALGKDVAGLAGDQDIRRPTQTYINLRRLYCIKAIDYDGKLLFKVVAKDLRASNFTVKWSITRTDFKNMLLTTTDHFDEMLSEAVLKATPAVKLDFVEFELQLEEDKNDSDDEPSTSKKRKLTDEEELMAETISQLKAAYNCSDKRCTSPTCYLGNANGDHVRLTPIHLNTWASAKVSTWSNVAATRDSEAPSRLCKSTEVESSRVTDVTSCDSQVEPSRLAPTSSDSESISKFN
ncbi:hypothetical protein C8F04DRAFT_1239301 [Mycena alexandri]|uniref:Uncharacterized protein n=1 Tax=Mycena alexandri TaxID=1745969 RepID=A0AAD6SEG8_9AGAR|nr:hypothetical protein C8F04DRAFT_1239301 [Mycena alexandri]